MSLLSLLPAATLALAPGYMYQQLVIYMHMHTLQSF